MEKTAVGLFENRMTAEKVVGELELGGLPSGKIHVLAEAPQFKSLGSICANQSEFEVNSIRELAKIGATRLKVEAYLHALRRGGTLILANSSDKKSDSLMHIMNQGGAFDAEELISGNRVLPAWYSKDSTSPRWI